MNEAGVANMQMDASWHGLLAPAKTPAAILARIEQEARKAVNAPQTREQFIQLIRSDHEKWGKVIQATGIKGD